MVRRNKTRWLRCLCQQGGHQARRGKLVSFTGKVVSHMARLLITVRFSKVMLAPNDVEGSDDGTVEEDRVLSSRTSAKGKERRREAPSETSKKRRLFLTGMQPQRVKQNAKGRSCDSHPPLQQ
ncbi:unnamed protein product [Mortierella alpina]